MFSQYRNKIIALFLAVCLLVTSLCVPVSAASSSGTMLYNGVELPDIESVWTDKVSHPYATIVTTSTSFRLWLSIGQPYIDGSLWFPKGYVRFDLVDGIWTEKDRYYFNSSAGFLSIVWVNEDILNSDGTLYLAASDPVDPNGTVSITGNMEIVSVHPLDDSVSVICAVDSLSDTSPTFDFRYTLSSGGVEVRNGISEETFTGVDNKFFFLTMPSLTPETEYTLSMSLYADGVDTGITASETFTTLAVEEEAPVDDTETLSLLSAILSAIKTQTEEQANQAYGILDMLGMMWLRLRYIEENTAALAPSKEETAIKEATKETTQAVVDEVFADDSATKVTASDIGDMADSGKEVVNAFDTGTTVGDFFSVFTDYVFTGWFSEETRANLDSVNSVSTFGLDDDPYNHDSYNKNMEALDKFLERSGKVND